MMFEYHVSVCLVIGIIEWLLEGNMVLYVTVGLGKRQSRGGAYLNHLVINGKKKMGRMDLGSVAEVGLLNF